MVGKYLLQRNVIKFTIPAVGVPLSMAINYSSTRTAGASARRVFRRDAQIVEAARRMTGRTSHQAELLWVLWLVAQADGLVHENERLLLKHVTGIVGDVESELAAMTELEATIDLEHKQVWSMLEGAEGDLTPLYEAGVAAAAVDGKINVNELTAPEEAGLLLLGRVRRGGVVPLELGWGDVAQAAVEPVLVTSGPS